MRFNLARETVDYPLFYREVEPALCGGGERPVADSLAVWGD